MGSKIKDDDKVRLTGEMDNWFSCGEETDHYSMWGNYISDVLLEVQKGNEPYYSCYLVTIEASIEENVFEIARIEKRNDIKNYVEKIMKDLNNVADNKEIDKYVEKLDMSEIQ
ncbi:hypothetical protein Mzhil_1277 [Methanosalsum zhilinae DSM 4017]|uniref:Uncharacterized protein n=1 Tax=Methanosalsum zhilinae (strain DSM 4017 / NBRC 107636 / OCM 62 / WeN5) TaxID=679901 RepID=F7XLU6_METZD|nr:hypothetical protein [Methanosalsum zhilinae]AEH61131.1 hypothetical protein Mzhil_1277 [Methanosalsum zhilinae DSM 4017]